MKAWRGLGVWLAALLAGSWLAEAQPARVELTVREPAGVARENEWVTVGVPFARGAVKNAATLRMMAGGRGIVGGQFRAQNTWDDGSVKWALCTFPLSVPANGEVKVVVADGPAYTPQPGLKIQDGADAIVVDTGALQARIDKKKFQILSEVGVRGRPILRQSEQGGAVLTLTDGKTLNMAAHPPEAVEVLEAGPYRALIIARGRFPGAFVRDGSELVRWTCQIYFYAGSDQVRVHYTLGNDGAFGANMRSGREYFQFKSLALNFDTHLGAGLRAISDEAEGRPTADAAFAIRQKGANRGKGPIFQAVAGDKELVSSDARSAGVMGVAGTGGALGVAVRDYWQNYPKEIAAQHGRVVLALWPEWAGYPEGRDAYNLCGGKQKTHEILLRFGAGDKQATQAMAASLNTPLVPLASAEHYAESGVFVLFSPADVKTGDADLDTLIQRYETLQRSKPAGLTEAAENRRRGNYYNWMNWGDLYWACGSASLHYDWTHIMLIHFLRTGQRDFFEWGSAMARHQYDIDVHRSSRDAPAYRFLSAYEKETSRGGTGWHVSTNPRSMLPIPSHNWILGQTLHALLTGDPESWACARINAEGVRSRMFGVHKVDRNPRRDQARTYGWSIECLLALYALTGEQAYLDDSRKLFENGLWHMFNEDGKTVLKWGRVQATYTVRPLIDYHWHTGDDRALDVLKSMVDDTAEWSGGFEYFMIGDGAAYVYYRTGDEAYLKRAREFLAELLKRRGRFNNRSGAWTKEEAKTSRSAYRHIAIERLKKTGRAPAK